MEMYSVKLGISLDEKSVAKIKTDIQSKLKNEKVDIKVDAKSFDEVEKKVDKINTKLSKTSKQDGFSKTDKTAKTASKSVEKLNKNLDNTEKKIKNANFATGNWAYNWSKAMQSFLTYNTVTQFYNTVVNGIQDMIAKVKELDDSLTELKKVTDLEGDSLNRFVDEAYKAGKEVAKTGTEMVQAATSFAKSGYDDEDALKLGKIAAMYTNIADEQISTADAADFIIAQMKAFNIEAEKSIHIIDAVNEVSNNFAVSSADIATNMGKASAVMANAGNSMEQMIGLLTAGTEITRNASKVSNGLKTITLRLQGMNDEGEEDLELQAQMEGLFKKLGISVYDANGELKNTYDILATLAPVYKDLTNAEKAYVTETIAGKYQAQNAAAILMNWETAVDATTTALKSNGSAAKENEAVLNSIQGRLQQLSSSWEELSKNLFNSDFLKFVIDLGTAFIRFTNSGVGQATIKLTAIYMAMKLLPPILGKIQLQMTIFTNSVLKNTAAFVLNSKATKNLNKNAKESIVRLLAEKGAIDRNTGSIKTETLEKIKAKLASEGLTKAQQTEILKTITATATHKAAANSVGLLSRAWKGLSAAIAANPIGAALLVATGLIEGLKFATGEAERAQEKYEKLNEEYEKSKENLDNTNDELKTTKDRINELKTKGSLTFAEKDELDKLEQANKKLETQAGLYEKIAEAKKKAVDSAANRAFDKEYSGMWSYRQLTNSGELKDMEWYDYINPKHIYDALSDNTANYGFDTDIITEAVNLFTDLHDKEKLSNDELKKMNNLEASLATELEELEKRIPNLTGKAKTEAEDLRNYIVRFVYPEIFQEEQTNKFFGVDEDDKEAQKIKNQFKDIQEEMDSLYQKGELTSKKIWELRKDEQGQWNDLDKYMRESGLDNDSIITYYEQIYKAAEESSEKEVDAYRKAAEARKEAGQEQGWDKTFLGYLSGEYTTNSSTVLEFYDNLKNLADAGDLSAESIRNLDEQFKLLAADEYALEDIAGILSYFSQDAQDTLRDYSSALDGITKQYDILTTAVDEYNDAGYLSSETLKQIIDNGLIDYLSYENGQLIANTEEFYNNAESNRALSSQRLAAAMTTDILKVATGNLENVSGLAASAIEGLGNNAETAGNKAQNATGKFISFAEAVDQSNKALNGKELTNDIQSKITAVQNAYKPYFDLLSQPINIEKKKYTGSGGKSGSGSSSKSTKEWWETELENLKDQFDNSEITINEYINSLSGLLGKVEQGSEAWKKINKELQKQRLDKVKDDYDAGRISLVQYINELKNLQLAYKEGTDAWNNLAKSIKKAELDLLKEEQDKLKDALSAVNKVIDKQIDKYEELKEAADKKYDDEIDKLEEIQDKLQNQSDDYERAQKAVLDFLDEQLESIENQRDTVEDYYDGVIDSIEKMNEEQSKSIELAEAYEALMNAMTQKTKKVYKEGLGWVWTADQDAIRDAKKTYEDLLKSATVDEIEKQKDATINSLEDQIKSLQEYIDSWDNVLNKFDNEKNRNLADLLLGENWTEMVSQLDPDVVNDFSNAYYYLQKNLEETEQTIEELNKKKEEEDKYWDNLIDDLDKYKDKWGEVSDSYEESQNALAASQILGANWEKEILDKRLDVLENFKNQYNRILSEIDKVEGMTDDQASSYNVPKIPGFASGGEVDFTGLAMLHGSPNSPEYVLNNNQMRNLLTSLTKPQVVSKLSGGNNTVNNYSFGSIELPNVNNAQQFVNELKSILNITKNQ